MLASDWSDTVQQMLIICAASVATYDRAFASSRQGAGIIKAVSLQAA
jgi:hypothetical protein